MFKNIYLCVLTLAGSCALAGDEPFAYCDLNASWGYAEVVSAEVPEPGQFNPVKLPHSWNVDDYFGSDMYRRSSSWYHRDVADLLPLNEDERLYLRFKGVGQMGTAYMGGVAIAQHRGSYDAFTLDVTASVGDSTDFYLKVSNDAADQVIPLDADYNFFGGIYRDVIALKAGARSFSRLSGGSSLRLQPESVSKEQATHRLRVDFSNFKQPVDASLNVRILDPQGKLVSQKRFDFFLKSGESSESFWLEPIVQPQLWSPDSPALYSMESQLVLKGEVVDRTDERFGIRYFHFDAEKGFFLNGEHTVLEGMNRHQDIKGQGFVLSREDHNRDLEDIKSLGCNFLRLAHYQQDDYVLDRCDELGLLVWEEIPFVNKSGDYANFIIDKQNALRNMIVQHYNHPSIILWGIGNEVVLREEHKETLPIYNALEMLNRTAKDLDPSRYSILACHTSDHYARMGLTTIPDVVGYNVYSGWYSSKIDPASVVRAFEKRRDQNPGKPIIVSEYGAGSDPDIHTYHPDRFDFSIEFHNKFLSAYLDAFEASPWLAGHNYWCYNDFASYYRDDSIPHLNQKGLVSNDRSYKKDAYYIFKARFSDEPTMRVLSQSWKRRYGQRVQQIEVVSNQAEVELFHGDQSLGVKQSPFQWQVPLQDGKNRIVAKSVRDESLQDEYHFSFNEAPPYELKSDAGDVKRLSDGDRKTSIKATEELQLEIEHPDAVWVKSLRLGLTGARSRNFDYTLNMEDESGNVTVLSGVTPHHKFGPIDLPIDQRCKTLRLTLKKNDDEAEISLWAVDVYSPSSDTGF